MSQKSSVPQAISFVSQVLKRDKLLAKRYRLAFAKFQRGCLWLGDC
jgi:hypothetical protein